MLALFACSPIAALVGWGNLGSEFRQFQFDLITGEAWTGSYLWGYLFTAIAVGIMPLGLLAYERGRGRRASLGGAGGGGRALRRLAAALAGRDLRRAPHRRRGPALGRCGASARLFLPAAVVLVAAAAPLVYYALLSRLDDAWKLAGDANAAGVFGGRAWLAVAFGVGLLAIPAAFAYRRRPTRVRRTWRCAPGRIVVLVVYVLPVGTFPYHAFQGLTLPLVVLGVLAWRQHLRNRALPLWPALAVAFLLIVPGTAYRLDNIRKAVAVGRQPHFLTDGEHDALTALSRDKRPGGVLAPVYMGLLVPAYTGRETWVGAGSWSPDFNARQQDTENLFDGRLSPAQARALVQRSGARFLLSDCHGRADITRTVAGFTDPPRRYGCATVWRVR